MTIVVPQRKENEQVIKTECPCRTVKMWEQDCCRLGDEGLCRLGMSKAERLVICLVAAHPWCAAGITVSEVALPDFSFRMGSSKDFTLGHRMALSEKQWGSIPAQPLAQPLGRNLIKGAWWKNITERLMTS